MIPEEEIKLGGMQALIAALGNVRAERCITGILRAPFDDTRWQQTLWSDRGVAELSQAGPWPRGRRGSP